MPNQVENMFNTIIAFLPNLLGAIAILVVGLVIAWIVSGLVKKGLIRTGLDEKISQWTSVDDGKDRKIKSAEWISKGVYVLILLFALIGFFQVLRVPTITQPLNDLLSVVLEFIPRILAAGLLFGLAWVLASVLRSILTKILGATGLDQKVSGEIEDEDVKSISISRAIANVVYWLVFLLFLPAILNALALGGLLEPVNELVNKILGFLPNLLIAGLILFVGWFVSRVIQRIVSNLLDAVGVNRLGDDSGINKALGTKKLSGTIGLIVFILILIPVLTAALNALDLQSVTGPVSNMLDSILITLPAIFAAVLILVVSYIVAKIVSGLAVSLLLGVGFDNILSNIGLVTTDDTKNSIIKKSPSNIAGKIILIAIMLFATIEALELLEFASLAAIATEFLFFASNVVFGLIIFVLGFYLANFLHGILESRSQTQSNFLAKAVKISIIVLVSAMALEQMGFSSEIIMLAFGLGFGAVAIALAIAFGLGGRDFASRKIEKWGGSSNPERKDKN